MLSVLKSGNLNLLEPSGPVLACNGIALPILLFYSKLLKDFLSESLSNENLIWELISASAALHFSVVKWLWPENITFSKIPDRVIWIRCLEVHKAFTFSQASVDGIFSHNKNKPTHLTPLLWPQIRKAKRYVRKSNTVEVGASADRLVVLTATFQVRVSVWLPVILSDSLPGFPWDIGDKTVKITFPFTSVKIDSWSL